MKRLRFLSSIIKGIVMFALPATLWGVDNESGGGSPAPAGATLVLTPETRVDAPAGYKSYRFRDPLMVITGVFSSITMRNGRPYFMIAPGHGGVKARPQSPTSLEDSHIMIVPGGYVDPRFLR